MKYILKNERLEVRFQPLGGSLSSIEDNDAESDFPPIGPWLNLGYHKATKRGAADADYLYARLEEYDRG